MRGSRVQAVVAELQGEKIDIIQWSEEPATFIVNALAPAEVSKVVLDEEANRIEVVVPDDQLSLAIGRRGQNVRLASQLTGWDIDIMTEAEESDKRNEEFRSLSQMFIESLDVDEVIAQLLVTEGFSTVEEVAFIPIEEIAALEGFDDEVCGELRKRARHHLEVKEADLEEKLKHVGVSKEVSQIEGLTNDILLKLGESGIKSRDDLADLASDELIELVGEKLLTEDKANEIIMAARAHWFEEEEEVKPDSDNMSTGSDAGSSTLEEVKSENLVEAESENKVS